MEQRNATKQSVTTELENCVLAIVGSLQSCTPYEVRKYLGESKSSFWSASAGAIYPLLDRLARAGLVEFEEQPFGTRRKRSYRLTASGRRQRRRWLSAPAPESASAHTYDPIRTRVFFLESLSVRGQIAFLDDAIAGTAEVIAGHHEDREERLPYLSYWELMGREGAIRELEARLAWLRDIRANI